MLLDRSRPETRNRVADLGRDSAAQTSCGVKVPPVVTRPHDSADPLTPPNGIEDVRARRRGKPRAHGACILPIRLPDDVRLIVNLTRSLELDVDDCTPRRAELLRTLCGRRDYLPDFCGEREGAGRSGPAPHSQHHVRCRPHEHAILPTSIRPGRNGWPRLGVGGGVTGDDSRQDPEEAGSAISRSEGWGSESLTSAPRSARTPVAVQCDR